ncbi:N-alpha-acetyltransferase 80 [Toxotes jaculatrix]|uniref:N-alpha-acetyltransferase 80 n=1 Tax=Toxotes jaculatrix TaxID=941984 RepID=UPI001B3A8EB9|nr:N-alpha-acetyltransferase 80 [Toxotes jaculatrix]
MIARDVTTIFYLFYHLSEPITSSVSKPLTGCELNVDLHSISNSDCQTQHVEKICEISTLDEEVKEKPHTDSEQPEKIHVVPIHRRPDLLAPCADLVNSEWQRSQAARVHSLQKSCPEFPVSLVLLQGRKEKERLLGHVRLSRVVGHSSSLFVESVVVSKAERGKGYGRTLMEETERYSKSRGFKRLCLTTHDKQHFYAHLGYVLSTPVQNAGAMTSFVPMEMLLRFSRMPSEETSTWKQTQTMMDAQIPQGSRDSGGQLVVQTLTQTPYRDAKGVPIYWMHKDI